jgi:HSP20 family molecular chaperone IbpA
MTQLIPSAFPSYLGFDSLFKEMDDLLSGINATARASTSYPPYNVIKDDGGYVIELAAAGFKKSDIKIELDRKNSVLVVSANKTQTAEDGERNFVKRGIGARAFTLSFRVSDDLEPGGAKMEDGILSLRLNTVQREEHKPLLITVD